MSTAKNKIFHVGKVGIANASPLYRLDIGDGTSGNDPASGYQFRINAYGDYIFSLAKQSTPSFSIRNNATSVVHLNTQNSKRLALGVSAGNNSGSIEEHVNIIAGGSFIVGSTSYGAAGSFSVASDGSFRQVLAAATSQDTLLNAISGVSNGFQLSTDSSNNQTYKFHNGSQLTNIIKSNGYFGTGTSNPVAQFVVSKQNGEGVEFVPGNRTDENDIYHYDRGSNVYCAYRTYATKHEFWRAGTAQAVEVTPAGNLKVYHGAGLRLATRYESHGDYVTLETDNHANTLFGMNLALNYTSGGGSGTHQVKQVNAHGSIGSAGIFIGGNGSGNNTDICFFRNSQGNSAGQVFGQQDWKFRIGSEITTNNNLLHRMKGFFRTDTSNQNANNGPSLAGGNAYAFGYQEAYSTSNGSWVHPYPDLVLGYHTGVSFGGHPNYNGCRFFSDHPSSSTNIILSVGNGGSGVHVTNTFTAGSNKGFRIAHPHPSKKYTHDLVHNAIEAPQMDLIYRGKIDLVGGSATVNIDTKANMTDGTFVLLNRDVQCFTSNETGWIAVKGSVSGNILTITAQDNSCTDTISWMVVGERQDDSIKSSDTTDDSGNLIVEPTSDEFINN